MLLLLACADVSKNQHGTDPVETGVMDCEPRVWYSDGDGDTFGDASAAVEACEEPDGYVDDASDCDDTDADVSPDGVEVCDGLDNDCDSLIDGAGASGAVSWYADVDGDGYGDLEYETLACTGPVGTVGNATDCDDTEAAVSPEGIEICDGVDNDCDGSIDGADASDAASWYADFDGDGYGDVGYETIACTAPVGTVGDAADCDDADAAVSPEGIEVCDGVDNDCDGAIDGAGASDVASWYADADGDGYGDAGAVTVDCAAPIGTVEDAADCDDTDAAVSPEGIEVCDGVDNDCDGVIDGAGASDVASWYADADGDGYGDAGAVTVDCAAPVGTVEGGADCDDTDAAVSPGGIEVCDGVDNDCDGSIDGEGASDAANWYADTDEDGYGDAGVVTVDCAAPVGTVGDAADCDDTDSAVSPDGVEVCDGVDNDCDGGIDGPDASDSANWYADTDGDGYGDVAVLTRDCSAPVGTVGDATDCDDSEAIVNPGEAEICGDELDNDCDGTNDGCRRTGEVALEGAYSARVDGYILQGELGLSVSGAGDTNGDGVADLVVAASEVGEAYLVVGPVLGDYDASAIAAAWEPASYQDGATVAGIGDADGDGYDDVAIGALDSRSQAYSRSPGAIAVVLGPWTGTEDASTAGLLLEGIAHDDEAGAAVAGAGDVDGDGLQDLLIGATGVDGADSHDGAVYMVLGGTAGLGDLSVADAAVYGPSADAYFGYAVAGLGDVDGDGLDDIAASAPRDDANGGQSGTVFILFGPLSGAVAATSADAILYGENASDYAGTSLAAGGDTDADGGREVIVGTRFLRQASSATGGAYLVRGPFSGTMLLADAFAVVYGAASEDRAGTAVTGNLDLDRDGFGDWVVGAPYSDPYGSASGTAYVLYGPGPWSTDLGLAELLLVGSGSVEGTGEALAPGGDLTGDGVDDLVIGAPYVDNPTTAEGTAWVLAGIGG